MADVLKFKYVFLDIKKCRYSLYYTILDNIVNEYILKKNYKFWIYLKMLRLQNHLRQQKTSSKNSNALYDDN